MKARRRWLLVAVIVAAVAIVAGVVVRSRRPNLPPPTPPTAPTCAADLHDVVPPPLSEKVTYAYHLGNRVGFPVVRGQIAACDVGIFLDTGVSEPFLMSWFADRLRLPRSRTDGAASDLGAFEGVVDSTEQVVIGLDSIGIDSQTRWITSPGSDLFRYGVAAIVPPQLAVSRGRVVALDFGDGSYRRLASRAEADERTRNRGPPTFDVESRCNAIIRVPLHIEGQPATFAVDTGSPITVLYAESRAGQPIASRIATWEQQNTTYGGSIDHFVIPNVRAAIGGMTGLMWMDVWKSAGQSGTACGFDGVLGVDFLVDRHCLLLFELGEEAGDSGLYYPRTRGFCQP